MKVNLTMYRCQGGKNHAILPIIIALPYLVVQGLTIYLMVLVNIFLAAIASREKKSIDEM